MKSLKSLIKTRLSSAAKRPTHMTMARSTFGRTVSRTGQYLRRRIWAWPLVAVVVLAGIGYGVRSAIETTMKENLQSQLQTLLNVETAMLETWYQVQISNSESLANDAKIREVVYSLLDTESMDAAQDDAPLHTALGKGLAPAMSAHDYVGYFVVDKNQAVVSSSHESILSQREIPEYQNFVARALDGQTVVSPPFKSVVPLKNPTGELRTREPTMYVCAPIRDQDFQVVAALAMQIRPEEGFTRILQIGRIGQSGETYAFNRDAVMVSNSRFDEDLILLGLLPDEPASRSILNLLVHDPGGNILDGYRATERRSELKPTRMVASAVSEGSAVDVEGYRDYRGVPVVGAWTWMADYDVGVTTEVDVAEAFLPLTILQRTFWALYAMLGLSAAAILIFSLIVSKMRREAQEAAVEAQQLGQYTLDQKIGSGAMGVVYKAHHAMLRRPTAVKLLNLDIVNDSSIARFEREVQITCQLNHPSTISIYDYGRTPEDVFYYAMEYLDGIDLQQLVESYGALEESRVIYLLRQMCGSLFEAHSLGLVHRDIKPANVMLNRRGGESDVVKVLDFGLVKAIDDAKQAGASNSMTGTPLYMSPEAIQNPGMVDHRSDIYAVGAVGYFLLTGRPIFQADSIVELCDKHLSELPVPPSEVVDVDVSPELESAIMSCLDKMPARRPQTAREMSQLLNRSPYASEWSVEHADAWWGRHERTTDAVSSSPLSGIATVRRGEVTTGGSFDHTIIGDA